ncbi:hypothetical protein F5B21DRAFT_509612 [Xylaria acuta]|nr:hypothetical protein F5B21DRAFT_509612 [Xylaria acuta]
MPRKYIFILIFSLTYTIPTTRYESAPVDVSPLARPLKFEFSGEAAKTRLFKAAMAEYLAKWHPTKGENDGGVITTGNIDIELDMVDAVGDMMATPELPPTGPRFEALEKLTAAAKAHGSSFIVQVTHPGRQLNARMRKDTISSSVIQRSPRAGETVSKYVRPREATKEDISRFVEYGGSLGNRLRLVIGMAEAIRSRTQPGLVLGITINSVEFQAKGLKRAEARTMCEAYFLEFVRDIMPNLTRTRKFLVGGSRTAASMA